MHYKGGSNYSERGGHVLQGGFLECCPLRGLKEA